MVLREPADHQHDKGEDHPVQGREDGLLSAAGDVRGPNVTLDIQLQY